jgi:hypothetical protein
VNAAESLSQLRSIIEGFFFAEMQIPDSRLLVQSTN